MSQSAPDTIADVIKKHPYRGLLPSVLECPADDQRTIDAALAAVAALLKENKNAVLVGDFGSGHVRFAIVDKSNGEILSKCKIFALLAQGMCEEQPLPRRENINLLIVALRKLAPIFAAFGKKSRFVATAAFREMAKSIEGCLLIQEIVDAVNSGGGDIEHIIKVITGGQEADYNWKAAKNERKELQGAPDEPKSFVCGALGGGTLQVVVSVNGQIEDRISVPCGVEALNTEINAIANEAASLALQVEESGNAEATAIAAMRRIQQLMLRQREQNISDVDPRIRDALGGLETRKIHTLYAIGGAWRDSDILNRRWTNGPKTSEPTHWTQAVAEQRRLLSMNEVRFNELISRGEDEFWYRNVLGQDVSRGKLTDRSLYQIKIANRALLTLIDHFKVKFVIRSRATMLQAVAMDTDFDKLSLGWTPVAAPQLACPERLAQALHA